VHNVLNPEELITAFVAEECGFIGSSTKALKLAYRFVRLANFASKVRGALPGI
jgi:hypothetical protein